MKNWVANYQTFWRISICVLLFCYFSGTGSLFTVTITSNPTGTRVSESNNTFDYPILSNVNLACNVTSNDGSLFTVTSYRWNTTGCYNHAKLTKNRPECFPHGKTSQSVFGKNLNAEDAGTISCIARINGSDYTSKPFTLRVSGE